MGCRPGEKARGWRAWSEGLGESGPSRATWKAGELGGIWGPAGSDPSTSTSSWAGGPGCSPQHRAGGKLEKPGKGRKPQKAHYRPAATGLSPSGDLAEPAALWSRKPMCPQLPGHSPTCLRGCPSLSPVLSAWPGSVSARRYHRTPGAAAATIPPRPCSLSTPCAGLRGAARRAQPGLLSRRQRTV